MGGVLSLNGAWSLTWAEGSHLMHPGHYTGVNLRGRGLLPAAVPAPIHQVLETAGLLEPVNIGLNSLRARWVEEQFWIYRHHFSVPAEALAQQAWLTFDRLELEATIWLNGQLIGEHANAHRPAAFNVTDQLQPGENLLVVQLSTGMHSASEKPAHGFSSGDIGLLTKRHWHRHPQYQSGWDWNPRLVNVGILGDVQLTWHPALRLAQATVFAVPADDLSAATVHARALIENPTAEPITACWRACIAETGQIAEGQIIAEPGTSRHALTLTIDNPRLWWPIHHGEQHLYTVEVTLENGGAAQTVTRRTGIRRVEIDQSPHPQAGRYFIMTGDVFKVGGFRE